MSHARFSPSAAHRWMRCNGSLLLEQSFPNTSSTHADEGTAAHELAAKALVGEQPVSVFYGHEIAVGKSVFIVDQEMITQVNKYVTRIREYADGNELMVEKQVNFSYLVDLPDQFGTSDAIIIADNGAELQIHDLKYGRGVKVDAEDNEQLMIYALAAIGDFGMVYDFERIRLVIHQPRLDHISEWSISREDLDAFALEVKMSVGRATECTAETVGEYLAPGEKQCRWCKAKATCPALAAQVLGTVADDFVALDQPIAPQLESAKSRITTSDNQHIANCLSACDLIEGWCKAIRERAHQELQAGNPLPGYKLVEGRRGARKWVNPEEVEATLKSMRLKTEEMYDLSLISPTTAEKLHKGGTIGPRQWPKLQNLITQDDGKPSIAPESDKRPALVITPVADEFQDMNTEESALV